MNLTKGGLEDGMMKVTEGDNPKLFKAVGEEYKNTPGGGSHGEFTLFAVEKPSIPYVER